MVHVHVAATVVALLTFHVHTAAAAPTPDPSGVWNKVLLTDAAKQGAVCLDGSPGGYYIRQPIVAPTSAKNPWMIFHEGGGWCGDDENCADRANSALGSSHYWGNTTGLEGADMFSAAPFNAFTIVYAKYCDGGSWTGDNSTVIMVGKQQIHYKGRPLLDALFTYLMANGLAAADELIYSGCSAGALTAYIHLDYIRTLVSTTTAVIGSADAMFSLQWKAYNNPNPNYYTRQFEWGYTAWNASRSINQECLAKYGNEGAWVCMHGAIAAPFLKTPMMVMNSKYDTWQRAGVLQLNSTDCPGLTNKTTGAIELCQNPHGPEEAFWVNYGDLMMNAATSLPKHHGVFLTNCPMHCETGGGWSNPSTQGQTLSKAAIEWYNLAMAAVKTNSVDSFVAPRSIAVDSDTCLVQ
eukprot:m.169321 g.169321  ORF g.169321 m.169321 type:complete len:408 (+) comp31561_c0_seq1:229-1452(+)